VGYVDNFTFRLKLASLMVISQRSREGLFVSK